MEVQITRQTEERRAGKLEGEKSLVNTPILVNTYHSTSASHYAPCCVPRTRKEATSPALRPYEKFTATCANNGAAAWPQSNTRTYPVRPLEHFLHTLKGSVVIHSTALDKIEIGF